MKINATIAPQALARLCDAVSSDEWPMMPVAKNHLPFVTIRRFKGEGTEWVEVELELLVRKNSENGEYDEVAPALVERSELNKLLDILGVFPQEKAKRDLTTLSELLGQARELTGELRSSIPSSVKRIASGSHLNNALIDVEAGLRTAIQAFEKMPS